ncbi:MAG TPA: TIM44-like domain-containing protein [Bosea sp. (in: a-proteobacteria)]|jgi:predicted lipid-binding transport protein (Tim44 family)|uniref:TIM44-like domain-containing protein n=1 Tax=Bosea sp. (in: a-proteobacteria) TaxID=1871050 RepID=UPI002E105DA8|nr:TIM44-like domain-containing protein [Bosea sp. (in: a-proteobacteria)]
MSLISLARRGRAVALVAGALLLVPVLAEARPGGGKGFGSRGSRTTQQVAPTQTAPTGAAPMQRTATPAPSASAAAPGAAAAAQAARPSFARNMMMGIGAGLLGAGLFGLLSGAGFGGLAGMLGMLFQVALIGGLIWLALRFFRRRSQPQLASASAPLGRETYEPQQPQAAQRVGGMMGGMGAATAAAKPVEFELAPADYGSFERLLNDVQIAYSNEDVVRLRQMATPEMAGYFAEDIAENASKGLVDRVADVKLLQGDLAESWREAGLEYATVAMRFSSLNALVEREGGRVVEGHATIPREVTELWTFVRPRGGQWQVSAIQPAE